MTERLRQVREQGINNIFGTFGMPGMPASKVLRSMKLFATEVMPQFKKGEERPNPVRVRITA